MSEGKKNILGDLLMSTTIGCAMFVAVCAILSVLSTIFILGLSILKSI